jgi:hypothetical protein
MGALMNMPMALVALCLAPLGLLAAFGLVTLVLKLFAVLEKATEPRTEDESGDYHIEQGKDLGNE